MNAECPRLWVVDSSPNVRETVAIVLGAAYDVHLLTPEECQRDLAQLAGGAALILGDDALPPESVGLLPPGLRVLWLQSRSGTPRNAMGVWKAIPRAFRPEELRTAIDDLVSKPAPSQPRLQPTGMLDHPVIPKEAGTLARRAVTSRLPVLICGEPGTGKGRLARAIDAGCGDGRFVALPATTCSRATLEQAARLAAGNLTVFVPQVQDLTPDGQQFLLDLLDCGGLASDAGWHAVRVIASTTHSLDQLARRFDSNLYYRLSVLPITLPPLRERTDDIVGLVAHITDDLCRALATAPVTFTRRALERLSRYFWFGNLAELEAVLTRTLILNHAASLDAEDLLFGYGPLVPRRRITRDAPANTVTVAPASPAVVDLVINELAHEFKNPMVTIKTVAQHLERLLADEAGREQVARLTGEAVDRMDRALENLLQFTRFRSPAPSEVALNALLAPCLTDLTPTLSERRVLLHYRPPEPLAVFVDPEQISYAMENLLRTIARELPEGETLSIHPLGTNAVISVEFNGSGHAIADKLTGFLDHSYPSDAPPLPLGLLFAKTLIERNGGHIEMRRATEGAAITISLPSREEITPGNGKATRLSS